MSVRTVFLFLLVLLLTVTAAAAKPETVSFKTKDGLTIKADLYASGVKGAPGVVALHMYRNVRGSWAPVAERFAEAGIDFLAIDMRGHGESAVQGDEDLSERVNARDATLFNAMHEDALAAFRFLVSRGTAPGRIGLLGASVGCSVAIDAAGREERIRGACVMTPGKKYLGVDTMKHLEAYGNRPLLVLSSEEEARVGARDITKALETAELKLFKKRRIHGTQMFGKVEGVETAIVDWFRTLLGAPAAMDGTLSKAEAEGAAVREIPFGKGRIEIHLARRGIWIHAVLVPKGAPVPYEIDFVWTTTPAGKDCRSVFYATDTGSFVHRMSRDRKWSTIKRKKAAHARDPEGAKGKVIEMLLPLGGPGVGLMPDPELKILVFARGDGAEGRSDWIPFSR